MRTLFSLGAFLALSIAGCSGSTNTLLEPAAIDPADPVVMVPVNTDPVFSCAGNSGNCGNQFGGQRNNHPNNPPATTP
jgi:hypothetical protein